jgi:hypothetical protein
VGGVLGVVGHGLRERQLRGPAGVGALARLRIVRVRRYRCVGCHAVITVVPRGVLARRHFGAGAVGVALHAYGCEGLAARVVRDRVGGTGPPGSGGWPTLRRWLLAIGRGSLFPGVRPSPDAFDARQRAERAAMTLVSFAPPGTGGLAARAFAGAVVASAAA